MEQNLTLFFYNINLVTFTSLVLPQSFLPFIGLNDNYILITILKCGGKIMHLVPTVMKKQTNVNMLMIYIHDY